MDIFTKQFNKDYFGSGSSEGSSEEYSIYYDPNTGEQKYYPGELPMKTGLPPEIEEGTPEAMEYKKKQIEVYGFPYEMISDSEIERVKKLRQETVVDDPNWARASKMLRAYMQPGADEFKTDKEYAEWGIDFMSSFENNFTNMVIDVVKLESAPPQAMHAMYYLMETADREGVLAENFWRGAYYTVFDYANLVGLGTMGIGLIGKSAGKQLTKVGFKEALKRIVTSKPDASDLLMAVEGATYAGGFTTGREIQTVRAGKKDEVDVGNIATSAAVGGTIGPTLNRVGQVAMEGGKRVAGKISDAISPSAESIAAKNVDQVIDDTVGVTPKEEPKPKPFPVPDNPFVGKNTKPFSLATSKEELIEGAKIAEDARSWYTKHNETIGELFGEDAQLFKELIGVTSQQASVDENIARAMMAYDYLKIHGSFAKLKAKDKNVKNPTEHHLPLLSGVIANLRRLDGTDPSATGKLATQKGIRERMGMEPTETTFGIKTYLGGNKVPDFVEAMFEGTDEVVTMDRHMIQILFGQKAQVNNSSMAEGKRIVTEIANELGWTPKETQAAIWSFNQIKDSDIVKRKKVDLTDVRDYKKAIEERRDAILELVTKFRDTGGQSKSVQSGSNTVGKDTGTTSQGSTTNKTGVDTSEPPGNEGGE